MAHDPSIDEQIAYYDRWNSSHRSGEFDEIAEEIRMRGVRVLQRLKAMDLGRPSILEVGCGTGWLSEKLCELGSVTAIDLSPKAIEIAQRRGCDAEFIAGDFYAEEFGKAPYDVGVCIETLFYMHDQPRFVEKFASLLAPRAVVGITNINPFVYERSSDIPPPVTGQVRKWLDKSQLRALLEPHFSILSMETVEPRGDQGILRLTNSYKVNAILGRVFSPGAVKRAKEKLGLGGGIVIMARKR
jgi:2-polyprenyl-3-methyl-5-hydroxy-6-metoxy-1,4-benzoquinol methylase